MPTALTPAPLFGQTDPYLFLRKPLATTIANVVGAPAITLPWSFLNGLPTSIQLMGRRGEDEAILNIAFRLEKSRGALKDPLT